MEIYHRAVVLWRDCYLAFRGTRLQYIKHTDIMFAHKQKYKLAPLSIIIHCSPGLSYHNALELGFRNSCNFSSTIFLRQPFLPAVNVTCYLLG